MSDWHPGDRLDLAWYERPTEIIARELLGMVLVTNEPGGLTAGRIVETEAYLGDRDAASHANLYKRGRAALIRRAGHVYMYRSYGIHTIFNIVTEAEGTAGAVLIRAIEPVAGIELMIARRGADRISQLGKGPGNLAMALGLRLDDDNRDLVTDDHIYLTTGNPPKEIAVSTRIGITRNTDALLRFFDPDSASVSSHRRAAIIEPATGRQGRE
ncbi:MAG TPA: DNA-3-methyladenine glycosylase [Thermomicrobiales bacterium]|nr:DNA-3-methyladenine glycosylase [Thermomicrobiales bacterium]